jgi:hypothetical protein
VQQSSGRILAIDFTKGILVLLMVVYHVLNYHQFGSIPHDYIGFLPSSFIMIAGFLAARVYLAGHRLSAPMLGRRLGIRALKLLLLFTCLNVAAQMVWSRNRYGTELSVHGFLQQWFNVYVTGDAQGVAFDVLVPISYTLLLAIPVLSIQAVKPRFLAQLAIATFIVCATTGAYGSSIGNLNLVSAGVIGMWLGTRDQRAVDRVTGSWQFVLALLAFYLCVVVFGPDNYGSQILITCIALLVIYSIGRMVPLEGWCARQVRLLGRYSLVSYVVQILYLQGARAIETLHLTSPMAAATLMTLVIGLLTWATVVVLDESRSRVKTMDRLYMLVFG